MKSSLFFHLLLNVLLALVLLVLGALITLSPFLHRLVEYSTNLLTKQPWLLSLCGFSIVLISLGVLFWSIPQFFSCHYEFIKGKTKISISDKLVDGIIQEFWNRKFPFSNHSVRSFVSGDVINIVCEGDEKEILIIKEQLPHDFEMALGFVPDIALNISHPESETEKVIK